ncbi:MAG TPA: hypothetical protein VGP70_25870 [Actinomadura sp.]|nr:hypothetical protein [Actinomadura sp.]
MSALSSADSMMSIAIDEAIVAGLLLPPATMIGFEFKLCEGKPENLDKAGQEWRKAAEQIMQVQQDLRRSVSSIPAQAWSAEDRPAYEKKVEEFCAQLEVVHAFCLAVGIALTVVAYALLVYAVYAVTMGGFLDALASAALVAITGVVTAEFYTVCLELAATCLTITHVATAILAGVGQLAAAVMAGGAMVGAIAEAMNGNDKALQDFMQAQATGSAAALANLAQNAGNAGLAWVNRTDGVNIEHGSKGFALKSIDIDADRNMERTWNFGGGVKGETAGGGEYEGGTHVKYGDRGWQGVEVEGKYKHSTGISGGGKAGGEENSKGQNIYYGGLNGGYEDPTTGVGASGGGEAKYNSGSGESEGKGEVGRQYKGGDVYKESQEIKNDGHGKYEYKHETNSWGGNSKDETPPWDR